MKMTLNKTYQQPQQQEQQQQEQQGGFYMTQHGHKNAILKMNDQYDKNDRQWLYEDVQINSDEQWVLDEINDKLS